MTRWPKCYLIREHLSETIKKYGIVWVTQDVLEEAFPHPPYTDFFFTIALVANGHRPALTHKEQITRFCKENDITETWYDHDKDAYVLRKSNWREIRRNL